MAKENKTEKEKFPYGKVKLGNKYVRKTKDGLPNLSDLTRLQKEIVKAYKRRTQ